MVFRSLEWNIFYISYLMFDIFKFIVYIFYTHRLPFIHQLYYFTIFLLFFLLNALSHQPY